MTRPTISWPGMTGSSSAWLPPRDPSHRCRSDPHTVAASIRTSSALGSRFCGTGSSLISSGSPCWVSAAARLVVGISKVVVMMVSFGSAEFERVAAVAGELDPDRFGVWVAVVPFTAVLPPDPARAEAAVGHIVGQHPVGVDPDGAGVEAVRDPVRALDVFGPHRPRPPA